MRRLVLEIWEALISAGRSIGQHKLRSILTTLGIVIGIASVTSMATVINGIERQFDDSMAELGADVLYIEKWPWLSGPGSRWWDYINRRDIEAGLAEAVQRRSRFVSAAAPLIGTSRPVSYRGNTAAPVRIEASTADYPRVHPVDLQSGRFYTELDDRAARNVAVIGAQVAEALFPNEEALGKAVRVGNHRFQVVGVLVRKGSGADDPSSADRQVKIPFNTYKKLFGIRGRSVSVQAKIAHGVALEAARDELTGIVRVARGLDAMDANDFEINDNESLREDMAPVKAAIYGIGIFLTALALIVGGIGVMNIMFVSVKERTREIGLRKAVGARRRTILTQFLIEAVIVCSIGGVIGVGIAVGLAGILNIFFTAYMPLSTVVVAFVICVLIGIIFGIAPAWTAARSDAIESLRYE